MENKFDELTIPDFLLAERPTAKLRTARGAKYWMPPEGVSSVLRAIRDGHDTAQKIRRSRKRLTEKQIRKCLDALLKSGAIFQDGRRYRAG